MRSRWRQYQGRTVRLHTTDRSIEGVLICVGSDVLVLRGATIPQTNGAESIPIEGDAIIERVALSFGQVL